jgi:hypothetical protein
LGAALAILDLLVVNGNLNLTVPPSFYTLRPGIADLVREAADEGRYRWFSSGLLHSSSVRWSPRIPRLNSDVWLYYMDRQSLLPRTHVLDGLEGAFDEDPAGWAPPGATLSASERRPELLPRYYTRLRLANVRWLVSFDPFSEKLATPRGEAHFPELETPLRLYELKDPLERSFWVPRREVLGEKRALERRLEDPGFDPRQSVLVDSPTPKMEERQQPPAASPAVRYRRLDPHTVRLEVSSPPGFVVVLDGYHRHWRAEGPGGALPVLRANGRYWALPTPGGQQVYTVRFLPPWRPWALGCACAGALVALGLSLLPSDP